MNLKGIIFDFDGTIADTLPLCLHSFQEAFLKYTGKKMSLKDIEQYFGITEEGIIKKIVPDKWEECLEYFLEVYESEIENYPDLFSGITDILKMLKNNNIKLAMVTGKGPRSTVISLDFYKLDNYFEIIKTGSEDTCIKDICMNKIINHWNLKPEEVAYLGDAPSDITLSKKAGVIPLSAGWASTCIYDEIIAQKPFAIFVNVENFEAWIKKNVLVNKDKSLELSKL